MDDSKKLDTYVIAVVSFWDQPVGLIDTMALLKIAEMENGKRGTSASCRYDQKQRIY